MKIDRFYEIMSNKVRRTILYTLVDQKRCTTNYLANITKASKFNTSIQLRSLRMAGLIISEKEGKYVWNTLSDMNFKKILKYIKDKL